MASAQAGTLEYQGVTFTSSWTDNVLTLEIDAANRTGDWAKATTIGALQLKDIGSFDSVTLSSAPGGAANWTLSSNELNANGCGGGAPDFSSPHLKLTMFDGDGGRKVGSVLSENIPLQPVPEPQSHAMMLGGLALMGVVAKRRKPGSPPARG